MCHYSSRRFLLVFAGVFAVGFCVLSHNFAEADPSIGGGILTGNPPDSLVIKNLVILAAFNDHYDSLNETVLDEYGRDPCEYEILFNWNVPNMGVHPSGIAPGGSVRDYFFYNSYNKKIVESTVIGWIKLPEDENYYVDQTDQLVADTLARAVVLPDVSLDDFLLDPGDPRYDPFDPYVLASLTVVHSGSDQNVKSTTVSGLEWLVSNVTTGDTVKIKSYSLGPALWELDGVKISRIGTFCHELAQQIFRLTELDDNDNSSLDVGKWCLMGSDGAEGFFPDPCDIDLRGHYPSHISAWSKLQAGLVHLADVLIDPFEYNKDYRKIYRINQSATDPCSVYRINIVYNQLVVETDTTIEQISQIVDQDSNIEIVSDFTYQGAETSSGVFRGGLAAGLDIEAGVIMTTGNAADAVGPNLRDSTTTDHELPGMDQEIAEILNPDFPVVTFDAAILKFSFQLKDPDILPAYLYFDFIVASEEFDAGNTTLLDQLIISVKRQDLNQPLPFMFQELENIPSPFPTQNNNGPQQDPPDPFGPYFNNEYDGFTLLVGGYIDLEQILDSEDPCSLYDPTAIYDVSIIIADTEDGLVDTSIFMRPGCLTTVANSWQVYEPWKHTEYLLIENRQPVGYERFMPQGGLAVWHIDELKDDNTEEGYPGQENWPQNNLHYEVALLQADGNYDLENNINTGDATDMFHENGVSAINEQTTPNTDGYQLGIVAPTGISISDIGPSGEQMCFLFRGSGRWQDGAIDSFVYNDEYIDASPVRCGQYSIDGSNWSDNPNCYWYHLPLGEVDCVDYTKPDPDPFLNIPCEELKALRISGTTVNATESWIPDRTNPRRWLLASHCAGYEQLTEPIDVIDDQYPIDPVDVWHSFMPCKSGSVTMTLCSSHFDTTIEVYYDFPSIYNGHKYMVPAIACNDDTEIPSDPCSPCYYQSQVSLNVQQGGLYPIRIGGYNGEVGEYTLTVTYDDQPANDECADATVLFENVPFDGTNIGATGSTNSTCDSLDIYDVWYSYTPSVSGPVTIDLTDDDPLFAKTLTVYDQCDGVELGCNIDSSFVTIKNRLVVDMDADQTYMIRVAGFGGTIGDFVIVAYEAPDNDQCDSPVLLDSNEAVTGTTIAATGDGLLSSCGEGGDTIDVWYAYEPACDDDGTQDGVVQVKISTCGSSFDTMLAVYDSCGGTELACNDDGSCWPSSELTFPMDIGTTYLIRLAGYDGAYGDYEIVVEGGCGTSLRFVEPFEFVWTPGEAVDDCLNAAGGTTPYTDWTIFYGENIYAVTGSNQFDTNSGTGQGFAADDQFWLVNLPFNFPFYGSNYNQLYVCSNGFLEFVDTGSTGNTNSEQLLAEHVRIAPLWFDLATFEVYIESTVPGEVTIRWDASMWWDAQLTCNFAVILYENGDIRFDYGPGNTGFAGEPDSPTVGISSGNSDYAVVAGYDGAANLGDAFSVLFEFPELLPQDVTLNPNGCFSGTPGAIGLYRPLVQMTDSSVSPSTIRSSDYTFIVAERTDVNADFATDLTDFGIFNGSWLDTPCEPDGWCKRADINRNGTVDIDDLVLLTQAWLADAD